MPFSIEVIEGILFPDTAKSPLTEGDQQILWKKKDTNL